jgi:hypothetical protein
MLLMVEIHSEYLKLLEVIGDTGHLLYTLHAYERATLPCDLRRFTHVSPSCDPKKVRVKTGKTGGALVNLSVSAGRCDSDVK